MVVSNPHPIYPERECNMFVGTATLRDSRILGGREVVGRLTYTQNGAKEAAAYAAVRWLEGQIRQNVSNNVRLDGNEDEDWQPSSSTAVWHRTIFTLCKCENPISFDLSVHAVNFAGEEAFRSSISYTKTELSNGPNLGVLE